MQFVEHPLDPDELNEYVDGELTLARRADVESHLAACAACQKTVRDLRGVSRDLAAWSIEAAGRAACEIDRQPGGQRPARAQALDSIVGDGSGAQPRGSRGAIGGDAPMAATQRAGCECSSGDCRHRIPIGFDAAHFCPAAW